MYMDVSACIYVCIVCALCVCVSVPLMIQTQMMSDMNAVAEIHEIPPRYARIITVIWRQSNS